VGEYAFGIGQQRLVDAQPDPHVSLPRLAYPKVLHANTSRILQPEALQQPDGDLLAREADEIFEGRNHISFVQIGAQFCGGACVGEPFSFSVSTRVPSRSKTNARITPGLCRRSYGLSL
jgi:hypothetical protein